MILSRKLRLVCLLCLLACTVGCDQASKHMARTGLSQVGSIALPGGFGELRLADNSGSFLSLGALLPKRVRFAIFTVGTGAGLAALFAYLASRAPIPMMRFIGLSLAMAGGVSNLLDRMFRHGLVTDFVTVRIGPFHTGVFNAADVLIMAGIATVFWSIRKKTASSSPTSGYTEPRDDA